MNAATNVHLADTPFVKRLTLIGFACAVLGIALSLAALFTDRERFFASYLVAVVLFSGVAVAGVFFSMLQYLVRAGWSAAVRRIPEFIASFVPYIIVLLVPLAFGMGTLYHHWMQPEPGDVILGGKRVWLNPAFFIARMGVYYLVWLGLYHFIVGNSFRQDKAEGIGPTRANWKFSAPGIIAFGVTLTLAAFDWLMSLSPHWYSTIYGVYFFAASLVGALAITTILAVLLRRSGLLTDWLTPARFHDLGKLLFAFNVFWAYIAFSQYVLIWYANIPEEVIFFTQRREHGWQFVSYAIIFLHFLIPFFLLLSQAAKRNLTVLLTCAIILLVAHFIDMYWLVVPNFAHDHVPFGWIEIAPTIAVGGLFMLVIAWQFKRRSAIPLRDPLLHEAR
jgi:hypothetical protein